MKTAFRAFQRQIYKTSIDLTVSLSDHSFLYQYECLSFANENPVFTLKLFIEERFKIYRLGKKEVVEAKDVSEVVGLVHVVIRVGVVVVVGVLVSN